MKTLGREGTSMKLCVSLFGRGVSDLGAPIANVSGLWQPSCHATTSSHRRPWYLNIGGAEQIRHQ